jgi:hypothetical protein
MLDLGPEDVFEGGVDLGEQAPDAVGDPGDLAGEVVVEADDHLQFGEGLMIDVDPAQGVWGRVWAASAGLAIQQRASIIWIRSLQPSR